MSCYSSSGGGQTTEQVNLVNPCLPQSTLSITEGATSSLAVFSLLRRG